MGPSIKYVRPKMGIFDPPLPLVRIITSLLLYPCLYYVLFGQTPPPPSVRTYFMDGPLQQSDLSDATMSLQHFFWFAGICQINLTGELVPELSVKIQSRKKETQFIHGPRKSGLLTSPAHIYQTCPLQRNIINCRYSFVFRAPDFQPSGISFPVTIC